MPQARDRTRPPSRRAKILPHTLAAVLLLSVACGGDGPTEPQFGTLEVRIATTGATLDDDGYLLAVDGGGGRPIGIGETARLQVTVSTAGLGLAKVSLPSQWPYRGNGKLLM